MNVTALLVLGLRLKLAMAYLLNLSFRILLDILILFTTADDFSTTLTSPLIRHRFAALLSICRRSHGSWVTRMSR